MNKLKMIAPKKYITNSGSLIVKYGTYNRDKYLVRDMVSKKSGFANIHLIKLLKLCDGTKTLSEIEDYLAKEYKEPINLIFKKIKKSVNYLENMGFIRFVNKPTPRKISFKNRLQWSLDTVYLEITHACNLRCIHCYTSADKKFEKELDTNTLFGLIDKLEELGVVNIVITGGEPLVRKDLFEVISYIVNKKISFDLFTNGTLLNKERIEELKKLNPDVVAVSLDGATSETHNKIRNKNCFSTVVQNISNLVRAGITVRVNSTIFKDNIGEIEDLIELTTKLGVSQIVMDGIMSFGRGKAHNELVVDKNVAKKIVQAYKNKSKKHRNLPALKFSDSLIPDKKIHDSICGIGTFSCTIKANGDVVLCPVLTDTKFCAGNVVSEDIEKIWLTSKIFNFFRTHNVNNIKDCKNCQNKFICLGGCKARAHMYHKSFNCKDDWACVHYSSLLNKH